jgi:hypothetical protein
MQNRTETDPLQDYINNPNFKFHPCGVDQGGETELKGRSGTRKRAQTFFSDDQEPDLKRRRTLRGKSKNDAKDLMAPWNDILKPSETRTYHIIGPKSAACPVWQTIFNPQRILLCVTLPQGNFFAFDPLGVIEDFPSPEIVVNLFNFKPFISPTWYFWSSYYKDMVEPPIEEWEFYIRSSIAFIVKVFESVDDQILADALSSPDNKDASLVELLKLLLKYCPPALQNEITKFVSFAKEGKMRVSPGDIAWVDIRAFFEEASDRQLLEELDCSSSDDSGDEDEPSSSNQP